MKIKFIDSLCTNGMHLLFNASLIAILKKIFNDITIYGEKQNINRELQLLKEYKINTKNIKLKKILLPIAKSKISNFLLYLCSFFYNLWFIIIANKNDILIFNYNNLLATRIINLFNKIFHRKILIFCHGELEFLYYNYTSFGPFNRFSFWLGRHFFLNKNIEVEKNIKFVVLGESILKNIQLLFPKNISDHFMTMDHAYFFKNDPLKKKKLIDTDKIKIGSIGFFHELKGANDFCRLVSSTTNISIEFSITGKVLYNIKKLQQLHINLPKNLGKDHVSREELEKRIEELDIILFLYPCNSYKLMASGAILDALSMQKPIIALKNDYFEYIFKKYSAFGYLFDSIDEIIEVLNRKEKLNISFNYKSIQEKLSVDMVSERFKRELVSMGYLI